MAVGEGGIITAVVGIEPRDKLIAARFTERRAEGFSFEELGAYKLHFMVEIEETFLPSFGPLGVYAHSPGEFPSDRMRDPILDRKEVRQGHLMHFVGRDGDEAVVVPIDAAGCLRSHVQRTGTEKAEGVRGGIGVFVVGS